MLGGSPRTAVRRFWPLPTIRWSVIAHSGMVSNIAEIGMQCAIMRSPASRGQIAKTYANGASFSRFSDTVWRGERIGRQARTQLAGTHGCVRGVKVRKPEWQGTTTVCIRQH
jgi:hypothetical protein